MDEGYERPEGVRLEEVAAARGWSEAQVRSAMRLLDGGMGLRLGEKRFEETMMGHDDQALEGEAWVYYLFSDRIEETEGLL
jgi:hypothetical protein